MPDDPENLTAYLKITPIRCLKLFLPFSDIVSKLLRLLNFGY